jgi:hypothetical protein
MRHCIAQPSSRICAWVRDHWFASGDANLLAHDVDARHHLADAVLDLDTRLHFGEVQVAPFIHQKLDRACILIVKQAGNVERHLPKSSGAGSH